MESLNNKDPYLDAIEKYGIYVGTTSGTSMLPMLRSEIDSIVLKKVDREIKKYDCVMYKRVKTGTYVLHRVVKIKDGALIICGDNQYTLEYGITKENIIGILDGFYRKEKYISINNFWYKVYYHLRVFFRPLRLIKGKVRNILSKIKHKVFKRE